MTQDADQKIKILSYRVCHYWIWGSFYEYILSLNNLLFSYFEQIVSWWFDVTPLGKGYQFLKRYAAWKTRYLLVFYKNCKNVKWHQYNYVSNNKHTRFLVHYYFPLHIVHIHLFQWFSVRGVNIIYEKMLMEVWFIPAIFGTGYNPSTLATDIQSGVWI